MAMGVLRGNGTQGNPWIVEDGWDLNALRNLPTTEFQWVEIANNISLAMFANWIPIPSTRLNINGNGNVISDLFINSSGVNTGLFAELISQETRNIVLDGEIVCSLNSNQGAGMLCGNIAWHVTGSTTPQFSVFSNIQCFGSIIANAAGAIVGVGGCFGRTFLQSNLTVSIEDCTFHGSLLFSTTHSSTLSPSNTQFRVCAGILGNGDSNSAAVNARVSIARCKTVAKYSVSGGPSPTGISGIFGGGRQSTSSSICRCIARNELQFTNSAVTTQPVWFGGIVSIAVNDSSIVSCGALTDVNYNPLFGIGGLHVAGIHCMRPSGTSPVTTSYAVIDFVNPNNVSLPATFSMRGLGGNITTTSSFFDTTVLALGWNGDVIGSEFGRTTAQLQSRAFLESQGWVFANV